MKKYILFPALTALLGVVLVSCSSKLYSDPADRVTEEQIIDLNKKDPSKVLKSVADGTQVYPKNTANGAVDLYNLRVLLLRLDYRGNDMIHLNSNAWLYGDYRMQASYRVETDPLPSIFWQWMYTYVYKGNQLLSIIPNMDEVTDETVKAQLKTYRAVGLTLRSWGYMYLMWLFQNDYLSGGKDKAGVPLYLQPDIPAEGRAPAQAVWDRIYNDMVEAVQLFKDGGRDPEADISDFDERVANMILGRIALTMGKWKDVIEAMNAVLAVDKKLMNETDYTTKGFGWTENVDEIIYGFTDNQIAGGNSSFHGWMNIEGDGGYGGSQGGWNAIDQRLYDKMPDTDYRKENFLAAPKEHTYSNTSTPVTWPKYASMKFNAPRHGENQKVRQAEIFIRTSEAYLMKAEAEARGGGDPAATLDMLLAARTKEGETPLTCATYPAMAGLTPLEMVQLQTRIELWGEGFEFMNNKRWNLEVNRQSPASANHAETAIIVNDQTTVTFQIPLNSELVYNPNITAADQNP